MPWWLGITQQINAGLGLWLSYLAYHFRTGVVRAEEVNGFWHSFLACQNLLVQPLKRKPEELGFWENPRGEKHPGHKKAKTKYAPLMQMDLLPRLLGMFKWATNTQQSTPVHIIPEFTAPACHV